MYVHLTQSYCKYQDTHLKKHRKLFKHVSEVVCHTPCCNETSTKQHKLVSKTSFNAHTVNQRGHTINFYCLQCITHQDTLTKKDFILWRGNTLFVTQKESRKKRQFYGFWRLLKVNIQQCEIWFVLLLSAAKREGEHEKFNTTKLWKAQKFYRSLRLVIHLPQDL